MATVNKNFRIKNGLIVEGTTGTIDGYNILTESQASQDFIVNTIGGTATPDNVINTVVKRDSNGNFAAGQITLNQLYSTGNIDISANSGYVAINAQIAYVNEDEIVTRTAEQQLTNKELVNPLIRGQLKFEDSSNTFEALISLASDELIIDTDSRNIVLSPEGGNVYIQNSNSNDNIVVAQGQLNSAVQGVQDNLDNHVNASNGVHGVSGNVVGTSDAQSLSNKTFTGPVYFQSGGGAGGSNNHIDVDNNTGKLVIESGYSLDLSASNDVTITSGNSDIVLNPDGSAYIGSKSSNNQIATYGYADNAASNALSSANTYTDGKVADLVASAPAMLDTLNELAQAIANNPNYATDVTNLVATKADTTYVDSQDAATLSSAQTYAAGQAQDAYDNAVATAATDATNKANSAESNANGYTDNAISNGNSNAEPMYKGVKLGYYTELISGWNATNSGATFVPVTWDAMYGTAKLTVHVRDGVHSQASELLVARDSSNNLHITEYAIVTTNGILADVSASFLNGIVSLTVSPTNGHTNVEAAATGSVIVWAD